MKSRMKKILGLMAFLCLFAFSGKAVLTSYAAPGGSFGDNLTWTLSDNSTLTISGTGRMDDYATNLAQPWFSDQDNIKSVVIEDGVTSIGNYAFANLTSLESVTIGKDAKSIGRAAFSECRSL